MYLIEREGPSDLDVMLEAFEDPKTKHIILSSEQASQILIDCLVEFYRRSVSKNPEPFNQTNTRVEALLGVVAQKAEKVDFTEVLETLSKSRQEAAEEIRKMKKDEGVYIPPKGPRRIF